MEEPRAEMRRRLNLHLDDFGDSEDELAVDESIPSTPLDVSDAKSTERERVRAGPEIVRGDGVDVDSVSGDKEHDKQSTPGEAGETPSEEQGEGEESQCRICFGGVEEEDTLGRLISPCLCTGSMRVSRWSWNSSWAGGSRADDSMSMVGGGWSWGVEDSDVAVKCINAWRGTGSNAVSDASLLFETVY